MNRPSAALAVALGVASATACHRSLARNPRPQATPPEQTAAVVTPPVLSDGAWIDSVSKSWSTAAAPGTQTSTRKGARPQRAPEGAASAQPTAPAGENATSNAELASMSAAASGAKDDEAPLVTFIAIGAVALLVTIKAARVALGG